MECDPDGVFFWVKSGGSHDLFRHDDSMMADMIQAEYFRKYGVVGADYYVTNALAAHRLRAKFNELRVDRVWKRAGFDGHTLWVDLGGWPRRLYGISAEKHGPAVSYSPDIHVVIERHGNTMPGPERGCGGWLGAFCDLLRVQEWQRPLFCAHLCHMFCMHHQTPAMLFSGPPGSGKTAAARLVRELVDPVGTEHAVAMMPKFTDSLHTILSGSPVVSFDNVRRLTSDVATALSGALEGLVIHTGGQRRPKSFGNVRLILTAPEGRPKRLRSLAGKIIRYEMPPLDEWKTAGELVAEFHSMRPHLYHEIFHTLHMAFGDPVEGRPATRMADFGVLGRAISRHAGYGGKKFDEALWRATNPSLTGVPNPPRSST